MRVLVIDDEKNLADTLVWILERAGFEATAAYDGESALQRLDAFQPDAVISDVIRPGVKVNRLCWVTVRAGQIRLFHVPRISRMAATPSMDLLNGKAIRQ